ncbi:hypothetical protein EDD11_004598 [Mortierella claussenii]|nr:hypothetical protein EDD11_004598 [Mortierella claussenii]
MTVSSHQHHHKSRKRIPEGVKVGPKGKHHLKPAPRPSSPADFPELVKVDVHCMMKGAITNKDLTHFSSNSDMPIGCRVTLKGDKMCQILDKLMEVVLPRMKECPGLQEVSGGDTGNIGMGFPPSALSLFPEIESNFDMDPWMTGFDITFTKTVYTNMDSRLLMSSFSITVEGANKQLGKEKGRLMLRGSIDDRLYLVPKAPHTL